MSEPIAIWPTLRKPPSMESTEHSPSDDLTRLLRWEGAGGTWQVLRRSDRDALISLCRCDGGEEADRYVATAPDLLAHLDRPDITT